MAAKEKMARCGATRVLAFTLAMVFALFFTEAAFHTHQSRQDDASCQVCQGAHIAPAPVASALAIQPLVVLEYVHPVVTVFLQEVFFADCPSRAPPALLS